MGGSGLSDYARAGGDAGPASWATRVKGQARLGWAAAAASLLLLFFFCLFLFSFFCFDSLLVRV